jgi:hypothetical protein
MAGLVFALWGLIGLVGVLGYGLVMTASKLEEERSRVLELERSLNEADRRIEGYLQDNTCMQKKPS